MDVRKPPSARDTILGVAMCLFAAMAAPSAAAAGQEPQRDRRAGELVGTISTYVVRPGDTLTRIGARAGVAVATLARLNGLPPGYRLRPGESLVIDNRHIVASVPDRRIVINVAQRMLFFSDGGATRGYPIGVGKPDWPTPVGPFTVIDKEEHPAWDVPPSIQEEMRLQGKPVITRMPPGPQNPLGAYFIRLSFSSLGIHGTTEPSSVYRFASHGCIRLHPDDVAALYADVMVGMPGVSVYEPVLLAEVHGRVYLEVHPDAYRRAPAPLARVRALVERQQAGALVDWGLVAAAIRDQAGQPVDVTNAE